jgi:hypothetical protein
MSKLDIINDEIARREADIEGLEASEADLLVAIEEFNKLDEFYREQEQDKREYLEGKYKESRHYTGEQPLVYTFAQTEKVPYFGGATDDLCNPYYPITKVQDKTFDGIAPLYAAPTRTGVFQRQQSFAPTEEVAREPALVQLQAFPDISNEPLPPNWPNAPATIVGDQCFYGTGGDQVTCEADGGIWGLDGDPEPDPVWNGPDTAPALLRVPLQAWRDDMILIRDDVYNDSLEVAYWQGLIDDCDTVLAAIASDAVFVRATGNTNPAAWGQTQPLTGADEAARARLETAADTGILDHIAIRLVKLQQDQELAEQQFFGLMGLRLHQVNGSFSKLNAAKGQIGQSAKLIAEHREAIAALNLMKVQNS